MSVCSRCFGLCWMFSWCRWRWPNWKQSYQLLNNWHTKAWWTGGRERETKSISPIRYILKSTWENTWWCDSGFQIIWRKKSTKKSCNLFNQAIGCCNQITSQIILNIIQYLQVFFDFLGIKNWKSSFTFLTRSLDTITIAYYLSLTLSLTFFISFNS